MDSVADAYARLKNELLQVFEDPTTLPLLSEHGVLDKETTEGVEKFRKADLESNIPLFLYDRIKLSLHEALGKKRLLSALAVMKPSLASAIFPASETSWKDILKLAPRFVGDLKHELLFPSLLQINVISEEEFELYNYMKGSSTSAAKYLLSIIEKKAKVNAPFSSSFIEKVLICNPEFQDLFGLPLPSFHVMQY